MFFWSLPRLLLTLYKQGAAVLINMCRDNGANVIALWFQWLGSLACKAYYRILLSVKVSSKFHPLTIVALIPWSIWCYPSSSILRSVERRMKAYGHRRYWSLQTSWDVHWLFGFYDSIYDLCTRKTLALNPKRSQCFVVQGKFTCECQCVQHVVCKFLVIRIMV